MKEHDLPPAGELRDKVILRIMGSPDPRQIDGLGGANALTSKFCIIGPSLREGADVDYTFGQVSLNTPVIDWLGNCGNLSSAVGHYAVDEGFVKPVEPHTMVRIYNTNTDKMIYATVPVKDGRALSEGDYVIDGCPGTGARILLEFDKPAGSVTKKLLPTGNAKDTVDLGPLGAYVVSFVDAGNPTVFLRAEDLGLKGTELPVDVENMPEVLKKIEAVRGEMATRVGLAASPADSLKNNPAIPKIGFVSKAQDYVTPDGKTVSAGDIDFVGRLASMQKMHRAYMVAGGVATGAASRVEGSVVREAAKEKARRNDIVQTGHPYGIMDVHVTVDPKNREDPIQRVGVGRTARRLMDGYAYVPKKLFA
jgi:2-methylaconitate cis-trans-isomerase PrpF